MVKTLKKYIKELLVEEKRCIDIDNELTEIRSDNYYYHTRAELLNEIINDLVNIITIKKYKKGDKND